LSKTKKCSKLSKEKPSFFLPLSFSLNLMSVAEDEAQLKRVSSQSSKLDGVEAAPVGGDEPVEKKSHKKRIEKQAFREIHVAEDQGDTLVLEEHIVEDEEEDDKPRGRPPKSKSKGAEEPKVLLSLSNFFFPPLFFSIFLLSHLCVLLWNLLWFATPFAVKIVDSPAWKGDSDEVENWAASTRRMV